MTRLTCLLAILVSSGSGCKSTCRLPHETGPGITGQLQYLEADGTLHDQELEPFLLEITSVGFSAVGHLADDGDRSRPIEIRGTGLSSPGSYSLPDSATVEVCLSRELGAEATCTPLKGNLELRALSMDCWTHSSGISVCAETIDASLEGHATYAGTTLDISAELLRKGHWEPAECED